MSAQRTIAHVASVSGVGLHSGERCTVTFKPAPADSGITFVRVDLPNQPAIPSHPDRLCQRQRRTAMVLTTVDGLDVEIHTPEHLLAACQGLGLDNLTVELDAVELPGLDGSAKDFVDCLSGAGIADQGVPRRFFDVTDAVSITDGKSSIVALPYANGLKITYTLDDHGGALKGAQVVEIELTGDVFTKQIAPARTFCMAKEVEMLRALGLGKGATYQNTCVYDGDRLIDNELRSTPTSSRCAPAIAKTCCWCRSSIAASKPPNARKWFSTSRRSSPSCRIGIPFCWSTGSPNTPRANASSGSRIAR